MAYQRFCSTAQIYESVRRSTRICKLGSRLSYVVNLTLKPFHWRRKSFRPNLDRVKLGELRADLTVATERKICLQPRIESESFSP